MVEILITSVFTLNTQSTPEYFYGLVAGDAEPSLEHHVQVYLEVHLEPLVRHRRAAMVLGEHHVDRNVQLRRYVAITHLDQLDLSLLTEVLALVLDAFHPDQLQVDSLDGNVSTVNSKNSLEVIPEHAYL